MDKKKIRVLYLHLMHRQSLISRSRQSRAASHPQLQSCSGVPNSASAPMDSSKDHAQYAAARKAVSQTNLSAPLGINQSQLLLPGFRMACTTASPPLGHAGASRENLSTARPPMSQPATAPPIGSKPSSTLEVETAGNRYDPGLSGNDAVTDKRMSPQYKVCLKTGIRKKMRDGCEKWRWKTTKEACRLPRRRQALLYFFEEPATIPLRPAHSGH